MRRFTPWDVRWLRPPLRKRGIALRRTCKILDRWGLYSIPVCKENLIMKDMLEYVVEYAEKLLADNKITAL